MVFPPVGYAVDAKPMKSVHWKLTLQYIWNIMFSQVGIAYAGE